MAVTAVIVDCFTSLHDLTRKQQKDPITVGRALAKAGRFSIFDATENDGIAYTMGFISRQGWFDFDTSCGYPWTKVSITPAGRAALGIAE